MTLPPGLRPLAAVLEAEQESGGGSDGESENAASGGGSLADLVVCIAHASTALAREISRAALSGRLGLEESMTPDGSPGPGPGDAAPPPRINATGDLQKKLDVFANDLLVGALVESGLVAGLVSEELDELKPVSCEREARFVLCIDPLDGSSNTDVNGAVGTIFGIYRRDLDGPCDPAREVLRAGAAQLAAGYVMYGASTLLVCTVGERVHGFTLEPERGEFLLSHPDLRCPERGTTLSANLGRYGQWSPAVRGFVDRLAGIEGVGRVKQPAYSLRYSGTLVGDMHRTLIEGGIYFYPGDEQHAQGKLRLLYECAPLALIMERAGGAATSGREPILAVRAETLHQRTPFAIGSREEIALYESFVGGGR
ncbi:MAG: fructose-1,6-bisphosphatase [Gemmatimonadetes bacterium]|nr:fructose-1,6-bisphosphatase [Gemmatimonadota bacterium]